MLGDYLIYKMTVRVIDNTKKPDAYCIIHDNYFSLGFTCVLCVGGVKVNWFLKKWRYFATKYLDYGMGVRPSRRYGEFKEPKKSEIQNG